MKTTSIKIGQDCQLVKNTYDDDGKIFDIGIEYVERSQDYWSSDTTTNHEIDEEMAIKVIDFLKKTYKLKGE